MLTVCRNMKFTIADFPAFARAPRKVEPAKEVKLTKSCGFVAPVVAACGGKADALADLAARMVFHAPRHEHDAAFKAARKLAKKERRSGTHVRSCAVAVSGPAVAVPGPAVAVVVPVVAPAIAPATAAPLPVSAAAGAAGAAAVAPVLPVAAAPAARVVLPVAAVPPAIAAAAELPVVAATAAVAAAIIPLIAPKVAAAVPAVVSAVASACSEREHVVLPCYDWNAAKVSAAVLPAVHDYTSNSKYSSTCHGWCKDTPCWCFFDGDDAAVHVPRGKGHKATPACYGLKQGCMCDACEAERIEERKHNGEVFEDAAKVLSTFQATHCKTKEGLIFPRAFAAEPRVYRCPVNHVVSKTYAGAVRKGLLVRKASCSTAVGRLPRQSKTNVPNVDHVSMPRASQLLRTPAMPPSPVSQALAANKPVPRTKAAKRRARKQAAATRGNAKGLAKRMRARKVGCNAPSNLAILARNPFFPLVIQEQGEELYNAMLTEQMAMANVHPVATSKARHAKAIKKHGFRKPKATCPQRRRSMPPPNVFATGLFRANRANDMVPNYAGPCVRYFMDDMKESATKYTCGPISLTQQMGFMVWRASSWICRQTPNHAHAYFVIRWSLSAEINDWHTTFAVQNDSEVGRSSNACETCPQSSSYTTWNCSPRIQTGGNYYKNNRNNS